MRASEAVISQPFVDARDGNNARPYCVSAALPATSGPLKFKAVYRLRASSQEDAKMLRQFLLAARRRAKTEGDFVAVVQDAQSRTAAIAKAEQAKRYEARLAKIAVDQTGNPVIA